MIPGGYGFEVLRFEEDDLRDIHQLPRDVRIMGALPELAERHGRAPCPREWYHGSAPLRPVYILICHRYCTRVSLGQPYQFTRLEEFLERYKELDAQERKPLEPCDPDYQRASEVWHRDQDGVVREYIWHPTGGWVPK